MPDTIHASIYDFPQYYELLFGSDWRAEFHFLRACFEQHATRPVRSLFEPACGTGRLLCQFAKAGFQVGGNDLNEKAVAYCNQRLRRHGFPATVTVGDMAAFQLARPADAAFNTINSFRHLPTEETAAAHLKCLAAALAPGGIYALGLHLLPTRGPRDEEEPWVARRGHVQVNSRMWSKKVDRKRRMEHLGMTLDIWTPTKQFRIEDEMHYRTYTATQMFDLLSRVPELEHVATYDFAYDLRQPVEIGPTTQDVVLILRRRNRRSPESPARHTRLAH